LKSERNVLLITYYWPPSGGAGVHRWLRFSNYFKENNCNLTVYCPEDAAWPAIDENLNQKVSTDVTVIRRKIFEPNKFINRGKKAGVGFTQSKKQSFIQKAMIWVRGNMFIPDSRVFWIKPSVRFLSKHLNEHPEITTIISTGPPHSAHLIAFKLQEKFNVKWIADFRDPWTQIDFYADLLPGKRADKKHKRLEKLVLTKADEVVTVSNACATGLEEIANRKIHVVTNGYDFPEFDASSINLDTKFTISHFGSMPFTRNPLVLWKVLGRLTKENSDIAQHLNINLIGTVDYQVINSLKEYDLEKFVTVTAPIPHEESIALQRSSQLLLLVANNSGNVKGILTGKFFEYLGAKRPIIAIGENDSDLHKIVEHTECGCFVDYSDKSTLIKFIETSFNHYKQGNLSNVAIHTEEFCSSNLVKKVIELL
jgi:glycosyltransferase involved in cell wall biosynthesis